MTAGVGELTERNYEYLRGLLRAETGLMLAQGKEYLVASRLAPVAEQEGLASLDALCAALRGGGREELTRRVAESVTINETTFFRDPPLFAALREQVLPAIRAANESRRRAAIWSAAAASGQEAYSVAMLLDEAGWGEWGTVEVLGTDICSAMVDRARAGVYRQMEVNRGLPVRYLVQHLEKAGLDWVVAERLRRMVRFERFDLRERREGAGPFDLILCRNVLLYFDEPTRRRVLENLRAVLAPGGWLALGAAEAPPRGAWDFEVVAYGRARLYRAPGGGSGR